MNDELSNTQHTGRWCKRIQGKPRQKETGRRGCKSTRSIHAGRVSRDQRLMEGIELSTESARPLLTNKRDKMKMKGVRVIGSNSEPVKDREARGRELWGEIKYHYRLEPLIASPIEPETCFSGVSA